MRIPQSKPWYSVGHRVPDWGQLFHMMRGDQVAVNCRGSNIYIRGERHFQCGSRHPRTLPVRQNLLGKSLEEYIKANRRTFRLLRDAMVDAWTATTFESSKVMSMNRKHLLFEDGRDGHRVEEQAENAAWPMLWCRLSRLSTFRGSSTTLTLLLPRLHLF